MAIKDWNGLRRESKGERWKITKDAKMQKVQVDRVASEREGQSGNERSRVEQSWEARQNRREPASLRAQQDPVREPSLKGTLTTLNAMVGTTSCARHLTGRSL